MVGCFSPQVGQWTERTLTPITPFRFTVLLITARIGPKRIIRLQTVTQVTDRFADAAYIERV